MHGWLGQRAQKRNNVMRGVDKRAAKSFLDKIVTEEEWRAGFQLEINWVFALQIQREPRFSKKNRESVVGASCLSLLAQGRERDSFVLSNKEIASPYYSYRERREAFTSPGNCQSLYSETEQSCFRWKEKLFPLHGSFRLHFHLNGKLFWIRGRWLLYTWRQRATDGDHMPWKYFPFLIIRAFFQFSHRPEGKAGYSWNKYVGHKKQEKRVREICETTSWKFRSVFWTLCDTFVFRVKQDVLQERKTNVVYWMLEIRNRDPVTNSDRRSLPVFEPGWVREAEWVNLDKEDVTKCGLHFTATAALLRGRTEEICRKMTEFSLSAYEWWSRFILQKKSHALKLLEKVMYIVQLKLFICDCFHKKNRQE